MRRILVTKASFVSLQDGDEVEISNIIDVCGHLGRAGGHIS